MAITQEQVRRVAALARLRLEPDEEKRLATDLDHILESFARLSTVDTTSIEPTAHVEEIGAPLREDAVTSPPATAELLANAPARHGRLVRVPKIIE